MKTVIDPALKENEFQVSEVPAASVLPVGDVVVFNIAGGSGESAAKDEVAECVMRRSSGS